MMIYLKEPELKDYGKDIKHIIIDESQDYTLLQFEMLRKIFNKASFTILGDIHQTVNPYYMYSDLKKVDSVFDDNSRYI
jgi:DNA helicase-2/ATP-dependent DNA helicase PcrA